MSGHGWCNFYLGLLEEGKGNASKALEYYTAAFRHAPELADPEINPEVLYSKLFVGALVRHTEESRFARAMPMPYLEPGKVKGTNNRMKRTIEAQKQKDESKRRSPEKASVQPATLPKSASDTAAVKPASRQVSPQRRRPQRLRTTTSPKANTNPDAKPDQPAGEKPPTEPDAG